MKVSEIMIKDVFTLSSDDTIAKALNIMHNNRINQVPTLDKYKNYQGMVFAKDFLNVNIMSSSKLKNFVKKTPVLSPTESTRRCTQLIVKTGNRALPVVEDSKLIGIISESDVLPRTHFGNTLVDNVMVGAIVTEDDTALDSALAKMRRYNISRLPVIDSRGVLKGVINALDRAKVMATTQERISKFSRINSATAPSRQIKVKDIMRKTIPVKRGTKLRDIVESFNEYEEIIVAEGGKPIGIVTARDALEITLPRKEHPQINIANVSDYNVRKTVEEQIGKFLKKTHGKGENVQSVLVYVDKYKTRKYSMRARLISTTRVIDAKAVDYNPLSASKKLVSVLDRRLKSERSKKVRQRQQHQLGARRPL
jgi:predicted transcriptional regulator